MTATLLDDRVHTERHVGMALALGAAGAIAALLALPYVLRLLGAPAAPLPLPLLMLAQGGQTFVLLAGAAWLGLRLGYGLGLDAPLLRRWCDAGAPAIAAAPAWGRAALAGVGSAVLVLATSAIWPVAAPLAPAHGPPWWMGLMASAYGGIVEEILTRLLALTLIVWCAAKLLRTAPPRGAYAFAIVASALLFGAAHLPVAMHLLGHFDGMLALQIVLLNAVCGVAFGALYCRYGLEHAMLAHVCADLVLHVAAPLSAAS